MILRLTPAIAELVGESASEWQKLEELARLGQATSGSRKDEGRLLQLAAVLKVELRVEDMAVLRGGLDGVNLRAEVPKSGRSTEHLWGVLSAQDK